ncbi:hypothetical protein ZHAS_00022070 [Anopheles sinensis]|uniref:Uncharacterized protein n=1 Tax=Anopheles sinensis TaxID=74873 RepID=A0A084WU01_ANOSI|nr:hypothetical protein ZHAS_00022070 [Anopheles sinensis]
MQSLSTSRPLAAGGAMAPGSAMMKHGNPILGEVSHLCSSDGTRYEQLDIGPGKDAPAAVDNIFRLERMSRTNFLLLQSLGNSYTSQ